jgi:hypothetical protein
MTWRGAPKGCECYRHEELYRDDGVFLGAAMQLDEDDICYHTIGESGNYWPHFTFEEAKLAVESLQS